MKIGRSKLLIRVSFENDKTQNVYKLYVDGHIGLKNSISVLNENSIWKNLEIKWPKI